LWSSSPKEKAVEASVSLNKLYQPFLIDRLHQNLTQYLKDDKRRTDARAYLQAMWDLQDPSIRNLIEPLYIWSQAFDVKNKKEADALLQSYEHVLKDSSDYKSKAEFYGLMLLKDLDAKKLLTLDQQERILDRIIANLRKYPYLEQPNASQIMSRAWHRYVLAYSMYRKFRTGGEKLEYLQAAAKYSPDMMDMQRRDAYYYDAYLLEGDNKNVGYQTQLINYLEANKRFSEELNILLEKTFGVPVDANMQQLKNLMALHSELGDFKTVWSNYVDCKLKQAPNLKVMYENEVLDFSKPRTHWTFIDVWGTWCSPCVKELPHLNELAAKYNGLPDSKICIRTFSYMSTQLKDFLSKNNYTFPVAEVGQEVTQPFEISSYPTKLLVSPDNKYLVIPFNVNWEEYMRNYTLFE
jgi:thiol-disulfide isomerase/thioredoxin